jgi:PKD repeat protein
MKKSILSTAITSLFILSCSEDVPSLGPITVADYSIEFIDSNTVKLTSTATENPFIYKWDIEDVGEFEGKQVEVQVASSGIYNFSHTSVNQGGSDVKTGQFEILKDIDVPCTGALQFLTECTSKTWKLAPEEGALWVGPNLSTTWWSSPSTSPTDRPCLFNDKWIFSEDGTFEYDAQGDIWGESYMGIAPDQCVPESALQSPQSAWTSAVHSFEFIPETVDHPDQIKVNGLGAFIGIPKPTNTGEVSSPVTSITYDIVSTYSQGGSDFMILEVNFGPGIWRYILKS